MNQLKIPSFLRYLPYKAYRLLLLTVLILSFSPSCSLASIPSLDESLLKSANGKMLLLDFYSKYCATCTAMSPHVNALSKKQKDTLTLKHIDVGTPEGQKYLKSYAIEGTPTYILFDKMGHPLYRMIDRISPLVLERQILRLTHQLPPVHFPESIALPVPPLDAESPLSNLIIIALDEKSCSACDSMRPFLKGFEMAQEKHLKVVYIDVNTPEGKKIQHDLRLGKPPGYVLLDNSRSYFADGHARGKLLTLSGEIEPKRFWNLIRLFSSDGLQSK